jgi:dihydrolipoamide dehydrogenase
MKKTVDVAIIGAGSAGLSALSKVRRHTDNFVLINGGQTGTTCARVGCMPSKAAIQVADDFHRRRIFDREGIDGEDSLSVDIPAVMEHVRDLRDIFVDQVLAKSIDHMGDEFIEGYARFISPDTLQVEDEVIRARSIVIATGSRPYIPARWDSFRDRIITTDELFEQESLPQTMAVIGLGIIGLEMGQSLHRLGVRITGIDMLDTIALLKDPVVNQVAVEVLGKEFPLWLGHAAEIEECREGLRVSAGSRQVTVEKVLVSMGRIPNIENLGLVKLGVPLDKRGMPPFDPHTMQIGRLPVFIAGDVTGERAILHEAGDEGRIAGFNAVSPRVVAFRRKPPLAITFCDPNIAVAGASWDRLDEDRTVVGEMRVGPVGRAIIMGRNKGILRVYAEKSTGRIQGAAMCAPHGEHLAHLLAWSIQQGLTVYDLLKMPYYHPSIEETLQAALMQMIREVEAPPPAMLELDEMTTPAQE